ncbi:hypothetical protein DH2020_021624 [Rehmannia glutinosa]|uniref:Reverse transcriptase zinc-binding domain-containing protein n=1 Tax=Rehmannia glutinosa TaxID=99300 RepID=A0ABR0WCL8_REHGL
MRVAEPICEDKAEWDLNKLREFFQESDIAAILAIPIRQCRTEDRNIWHFSKDGNYSVKTGYKIARARYDDINNAASASGGCKKLWRWIWNLPIPPKVQVFLWKCAQGILPTSQALISKGVKMEPYCKRCGEYEETAEHALRDCEWVKLFWATSPLRIRETRQDGGGTIADWMEEMMTLGSKESHSLFAMLLHAVGGACESYG